MFTLGLTNTPGSVLEDLCDESVCFPTGQRCGPDVSVLTTRLVLLYLLGLEIGVATASLTDREADELGVAIAQLPNAAAQFLMFGVMSSGSTYSTPSKGQRSGSRVQPGAS